MGIKQPIYNRAVSGPTSGVDASGYGLLPPEALRCLLWSANGLADHEMAATLRLSELTVNHYFDLACKTLGANNRTHALGIALRLGLLTLDDLT